MEPTPFFVSIRNKPTFGGAKFWRTLLPKTFAMFNLNENNRFVMAQQPSDMRAGVINYVVRCESLAWTRLIEMCMCLWAAAS